MNMRIEKKIRNKNELTWMNKKFDWFLRIWLLDAAVGEGERKKKEKKRGESSREKERRQRKSHANRLIIVEEQIKSYFK